MDIITKQVVKNSTEFGIAKHIWRLLGALDPETRIAVLKRVKKWVKEKT